jgi:hypothetical protein
MTRALRAARRRFAEQNQYADKLRLKSALNLQTGGTYANAKPGDHVRDAVVTL